MNRLAFLLLLCAGVFWGLGFPLGKVALSETDPAHMVLWRFVFASVIALPFALRRPEARALFRSPMVLACGVTYALAFEVQNEGLARASVSLAALLVGAMPALIAVAARLLGEPVSRLSWTGVGAATLGAGLIAGRPAGAATPLGVALSLIALLLFLTWLIMLRRAPKAPTPMAIPAVTVIIAAVVLVPVSFALHGPPRFDLSLPVWGAVIAQGVFCTFLATAAWQFGAPRVGHARAGVFVNIEPLMGAIIGVALFGDHLTWGLAVGGLCIIAGSLIVVLGERRTTAPDLQAVTATPG
jgi:drug/metabolite transporter (DMT)-like permease